MKHTGTDTCEIESVDNIRVLGGFLGTTALGLCTFDNVCNMGDRVLGVGTLSRGLRHLREGGYTKRHVVYEREVTNQIRSELTLFDFCLVVCED
jgi:hypothetical protein